MSSAGRCEYGGRSSVPHPSVGSKRRRAHRAIPHVAARVGGGMGSTQGHARGAHTTRRTRCVLAELAGKHQQRSRGVGFTQNSAPAARRLPSIRSNLAIFAFGPAIHLISRLGPTKG